MLDIRCRRNRPRLLSPPYTHCAAIWRFNCLIPDAALPAPVDPIGEVAPKINNLRILRKQLVLAKLKASTMPSGGTSKAMPGLSSTLSLVFDAPFDLIFFPQNYNIVSILNENVLLHLSFR